MLIEFWLESGGAGLYSPSVVIFVKGGGAFAKDFNAGILGLKDLIILVNWITDEFSVKCNNQHSQFEA